MTTKNKKSLAPEFSAHVKRPVKRPVKIAVVQFHGKIQHEQDAQSSWFVSYDSHRAAITAAFAWPQGKAVVLDIDSPGGSPAEAYMLVREIRRQAEIHQKPVYAFVRRAAQSSGYWLACAADQIYALPISDIGSIGVRMSAFGYHKKNQRAGVERRVFTAGAHKAELDDHLPLKKSDVENLQKKLNQAHLHFIEDVRQLRGGRITASDKKVMNGSSWLAAEALKFGLIDGIGDMMDVLPGLMNQPVRVCVFKSERREISPSPANTDMPESGQQANHYHLTM